VPKALYTQGLKLIRSLKIDSLRAEITLFEAIKALAALDNRKEANQEDLQVIAPMALRMRRSEFIEKYLSEQSNEEVEINKAVDSSLSRGGLDK
jgi:magnesium chelatase subunit I